MGLILAAENLLVLRDDGGRMFRNMVEFGKPLFFDGGRTPRCRLPQQYCELNLVGLRYLAIDIRYPLSGKGHFLHPQTADLERVSRSNNYDNRMAALMKSAREIEVVLWKCKSLETFRLILQTDAMTCWEASGPGNRELEYCGVTEDNHTDMLELLHLFLNAAKSKNFRTAAEECRDFFVTEPGMPWIEYYLTHYQDPLVKQYNCRAQELGLQATFDRNVNGPEFQGHTKRQVKAYNPVDASQPFQLRPECRECYELFASFEGLQHHLQEFPKHRIPFKRKRYSTLNYWAQRTDGRKCWTCAKSYVSREFLAKHLDSCGHRREGIIPRWKQDNGWMNRKDGARKAKREEAQRLRLATRVELE